MTKLISVKRLACLLATALLLAQSAHAATSTWNNGSGGDWSTPTNWSGTDTPPLAADTALFNTGAGTSIAVTNASSNSVTSISFDTSAGSYTIGTTGGGALTLASSGTAQILSSLTATNAVEAINAPIILTGISGTAYTFANNSANGIGAGAGTLDFGGTITSASTSGTTTLALGGSNTNANTVSGVISNGTGTNVVALNDQGTWVLSGNNTFTGGVTLSGTGTLDINSAGTSSTNSAIGTGTLAIGAGGTIDNTSGSPLTLGTNNAITFSAFTFGGSNNLNMGNGNVSVTSNTDSVTLNGTNKTLTFGGTATQTQSASNHIFTISNGVGGGGNTIVFGTYILGTSTTSAQNVTFQGTANITITGPVQDNVHGGGILTDTNTGTLTLQSGLSNFSGGASLGSTTGNNSVILGASSTVSAGAITSGPVGTGTLTFVGPTSTTVTVDDNGTNITLANAVAGASNLILGSVGGGSITFDGTSLTTPSAWTMNTNNNLVLTVNNTTTIKDAISGGHALIQNGAGTLVLSGANTYTGGTTVSSGVLLVNNTTGSGIGTKAVQVNSGATLGGSGIIATTGVTTAAAVAVEIASGGKLSPSNGLGALHLTLALVSGTKADLATGSQLVFDLGSSTSTSDEVLVTGGTLSLNTKNFSDFTFNALAGIAPGTYTLMDSAAGITGSLGVTTGTFDGGLYNGTLSLTGNDLQLLVTSAVPEPGTWAMMLGGLGLLLIIQRRRNRLNSLNRTIG